MCLPSNIAQNLIQTENFTTYTVHN